MDKQCSCCHTSKPMSEFNSKTQGKLQPYCRLCQNQWSRQHYRDNKSWYYDRNKKQQLKLQEWYQEYKKTLECSRCPENDPICLDFHHLAEDKNFTISTAVRSRTTKERILQEIQKCIILCSNCHRKHHRDVV